MLPWQVCNYAIQDDCMIQQGRNMKCHTVREEWVFSTDFKYQHSTSRKGSYFIDLPRSWMNCQLRASFLLALCEVPLSLESAGIHVSLRKRD